MVQKARELCEDLLENVKEQYEQFKSRPPRTFDRFGGHGDRSGSYSERSGGYGGDRPPRDGGNSYHHNQNYNNNNGNHHGYSESPRGANTSASPPPPTGPSNATPAATDYAAQYAQYYNNGVDPFAAYGGYNA